MGRHVINYTAGLPGRQRTGGRVRRDTGLRENASNPLMLRLSFSRKDLCERMHLDPFKDAVNRIRVFPSECLGFFQRIGVDDNEAAGFIRERAGKDDPAGAVERLHLREVCRTMDLSLGLAVGTIKAENDEFHASKRA